MGNVHLPQVQAIYESPVEDGLSRFQLWEEGRSPGSSCTPSTFDRTYLGNIAGQIESILEPLGGERILSLGCGNGFIERELVTRGHTDILATDVSKQALELASAKGLDTTFLDATINFPFGEDEGFDMIISDGVIGHLADERGSLAGFFKRCGSILNHGGVLFMGNDTPMTAEAVQKHHKLDGIYWFSIAHLLSSLGEAGYEDVQTRIETYQRPELGPRDRVWAWGKVQ
jgi:SAM-dependent methyltransferase